jgi:hypothetical protein
MTFVRHDFRSSWKLIPKIPKNILIRKKTKIENWTAQSSPIAFKGVIFFFLGQGHYLRKSNSSFNFKTN